MTLKSNGGYLQQVTCNSNIKRLNCCKSAHTLKGIFVNCKCGLGYFCE